MLPVVPLTSHICIYNSTIGSQRIVCFVITRKLCHNRNNFLLNLECPLLQRLKFDLLISHVISLWQIFIFLLNQIIILCCYTLWQHETPRISLPFFFNCFSFPLCSICVWLVVVDVVAFFFPFTWSLIQYEPVSGGTILSSHPVLSSPKFLYP